MATTYSYSGATYLENQLQAEILALGAAFSGLTGINGTGATGNTGTASLATAVAITFSSALSGGDKTTLDTTVTNHTPNTVATQTPVVPVNLLANGGMDFFQRQTPGTYTTVAQDGYGPDRWRLSRENAGVQTARTDNMGSGGLGARYIGGFKKITSTGKFMVIQILEGRDSQPISGGLVTFQCRLKASSSKTIRLGIIGWAGAVDAWPAATVSAWGANSTDPTLGTSLSYVGTPVSVTAPTASYPIVSFTAFLPVAGGGSNSNNYAVAMWTDSQFAANDILYMTEAMLIPGSQPFMFYPPNLQAELARCQRYYEKSFDIDTIPADGDTTAIRYNGSAYDTGNMSVYQSFQASKRITAATLTYYRSSVGASAGKWSYYNAGWNDSTTTVNTAASQQGFCTEVRKTLAFTGLSDYLVAGGWAASCEL